MALEAKLDVPCERQPQPWNRPSVDDTSPRLCYAIGPEIPFCFLQTDSAEDRNHKWASRWHLVQCGQHKAALGQHHGEREGLALHHSQSSKNLQEATGLPFYFLFRYVCYAQILVSCFGPYISLIPTEMQSSLPCLRLQGALVCMTSTWSASVTLLLKD